MGESGDQRVTPAPSRATHVPPAWGTTTRGGHVCDGTWELPKFLPLMDRSASDELTNGDIYPTRLSLEKSSGKYASGERV